MRVSKQNAEGYSDPTAYKALTRVMREGGAGNYKPLVYICSPYAGDIETNTQNAQSYCRFAVDRDCIPIAPHLLFPQFMDDTDADERELALFFAKVLLGKCDEIWVFGDNVTAGMASEIARARFRNMTIRSFDTKCGEVTAP